MDPLTLVIDTTRSWLSIGLFGRNVRRASTVLAPREAFHRLTLDLQELLAGQIPECIVCVTGPGSFTGIRIGVSCARNLAQLWDIPAAGISSLGCAAHGLIEQTPPYAVCIDGKQKRYYTLLVERAVSAPELARSKILDLTAKEIAQLGVPVYADGQPENVLVHELPPPDPETMLDYFLKSQLPLQSFDALVPYYHRQDPAEQKYPEGFQRK